MSSRVRQAESRARDAHDELRALRLRAREAEHDARLAHDQVRELKDAAADRRERSEGLAFRSNGRNGQEADGCEAVGKLRTHALSVDSLSNALCDSKGENERLTRALDKVQVKLRTRVCSASFFFA